jgi:hypothetical protein
VARINESALGNLAKSSLIPGTGEPYSLEAVWFMCNSQSMSWTDSVWKCATKSRQQCMLHDKIDIND